MKITIKSAKSKVSAALKTATTKATKSEEKPSPFKVLKSYNCKHLIDLGQKGLGTNLGVCGREILDGYVTDLIEQREKLTSARVAAADKVLLIESPMWQRSGPRMFAWPVVGQSGDIIEVKENYWRAPKANKVRTSLSLLKKHVAAVKEGATPTVVRIVSKTVAAAEMAKAKLHMGSREMFEAAKS